MYERSAVELSGMLSRQEISSEALVRACLARADAVDGKVRALVHRFDEAAIDAAKAIDRRREAGETLPALAGLPITVKESVATAGVAATLGIPSRQTLIEHEDAVVIRLLKEAGAIVIGKTNLAETLLFHEADNPIWGATNNPWDPTRTPGGSSGGEAAAIAAGIAPLGVGTDIGGSIRIPAAWTGIVGFKPTVDRWSNVGSGGVLVGQEVIRSQIGPLARTTADLVLAMSAIDPVRQASLDPSAPPVPFTAPDGEGSLKGVRVGFYSEDGFLSPAASVRRAVDEAVKAAAARGAEVVPFPPPSVSEVMDVYFSALSSDGGELFDRALGKNPLSPQLVRLRKIAGLPAMARRVAEVAARARGEKRIERLLQIISKKPVSVLWDLTWKRTLLRRRWLAAFREAGVEVVICPAHVTPALQHGASGEFTLGGAPSMLYNFLNFPAGVVPVTRVAASDAVRAHPRDRIEHIAASVETGAAGLPLGVQVVGHPWQEDRVLRAMLAIEAELRAGTGFPRTPVEPPNKAL